jgi:hypothetical protein
MRTGELGPKLLDTAEILGACLDAADAASRAKSIFFPFPTFCFPIFFVFGLGFGV